jgi:membrane-associated protease RseP (regulator of RpoE activity)
LSFPTLSSEADSLGSPAPLPVFYGVLPARRRSWWTEWGRHVALFVITAGSVYVTGGPLMAVGVMSILLAHEMGHYVACRIHHVDATLPFFIPAPFINPLVGTMGAVIRIRQPFPNRRALFDIGIAGPIAGFVVCLPVLVLAAFEAQMVPDTPGPTTISLGDPRLFVWAVAWLRGATPPGMTLAIGPLGMSAWFGMFVTALNLIPIGQLDGGHVTYALFGARANAVSRFFWWVAVAMIYFSPSWIVWVLLLRLLGRRHPPTLDDRVPLGRGRMALGLLAAMIFAVCFIPSPVVGSWDAIWQELGPFLHRLTSR